MVSDAQSENSQRDGEGILCRAVCDRTATRKTQNGHISAPLKNKSSWSALCLGCRDMNTIDRMGFWAAIVLIASTIGCGKAEAPSAPALSSLRGKISVVGSDPNAITLRLEGSDERDIKHGDSEGMCPNEEVTATLNDKLEERSSFRTIEKGDFENDAYSCAGPSFRFELSGLSGILGSENLIRIRTAKDERVIYLRQQAHSVELVKPEILHPGEPAEIQVIPAVKASDELTIGFECSGAAGGFVTEGQGSGSRISFVVPQSLNIGPEGCEGKLRVSSADWQRWYVESGDVDVIWDFLNWGNESGIVSGDSAWLSCQVK